MSFKMKADDLEEVVVLSALFQDTLVPISALDYDAKAHQFVLMGFRFKWENTLDGGLALEKGERVFSGLSFSNITGIRYVGFQRDKKNRAILNLLAFKAEGKNTLRLFFSGKSEIVLTYDGLLIYGQDLKNPWPSVGTPTHSEEVAV